MPNWKKVITSGSNALLNDITASGAVTSTTYYGDGSNLTGITGISFNGSTANGLVTYGSATTADVESKLTFDASTLLISSTNIDSTGVKIYGGVAFAVSPYITPEGNHATLNFGDATSGLTLQMLNNKLAFDNDASNTYIQADTDTPENLEIHADGNIELRADDELQIFSDISTTGAITGNGSSLSVSQIITGIGAAGAAGEKGLNAETTTITTTTGLSAGYVYYLESSGWVGADASAISTSDGLMGVATSTTSADGMVIRGIVYMNNDPGGAIGDVCYLSTATGRLSTTPVSVTGDVNRVMGYKIGTNLVFFDPSRDWIEIS